MPGKARFDHDGIDEQRHERTRVGECEVPVRERVVTGACIPTLEQRSGRREQQIRQADRRGEHGEQIPGGVVTRRGLPAYIWQDRERQKTQHQQDDVDHRLTFRRQAGDDAVSVQIPK